MTRPVVAEDGYPPLPATDGIDRDRLDALIASWSQRVCVATLGGQKVYEDVIAVGDLEYVVAALGSGTAPTEDTP